MGVFRRERIQNRIAHIISELILREEIQDYRVRGVISISSVKISKDAAYAKVMVSGLLEQDKLIQAVEGLNSAAGHIQQVIASRLRTRHTPQLRFEYDDGVAHGFEIAEKLRELNIQAADSPDTPENLSENEAEDEAGNAADLEETSE